MPYHVPCTCGEFVTVSDGQAGTNVPCPCGLTVPVPSLGELRRETGQLAKKTSPELAVETLLLAGKLPEERHCVLCRVETDRTVRCLAECERARVLAETPWWVLLLIIATFGLLGLAIVLLRRRGEREWGKDRTYPLPLRVCDDCRAELTDPEELREALCFVPLYRRLLDKYPEARLSVLGGGAE